MSDNIANLQDSFGYLDGETKCAKCGEVLTRENAHWGHGAWWHKLVADCDKHLNHGNAVG